MPTLRAALVAVPGLAAALIAAGPAAGAGSCSAPPEHWLACEDFERGRDFADWFAGSPFVSCKGCGPDNAGDPNRARLSRDQVHSGQRALYLPAAEAADFQGATLTWRSCAGDKREGCPLRNHPALYFRAWVRLAEDHRYVHHFLRLGGSRPLHFWDSEGNAGCRPNGYRSAGTTLDFNRRHELFFYT